MRYVTGQHALNLKCSLETCGDWHQSAIQWKNPTIRNTDESIFGDYGIEKNVSIPEHKEKFCVANHIRALLDLLETGMFTLAQGMRDDYICNGKYTQEIFCMVTKLQDQANWKQVDKFMEREYMREWIKYKEGNNDRLAS